MVRDCPARLLSSGEYKGADKAAESTSATMNCIFLLQGGRCEDREGAGARREEEGGS